MLPLRDDSTMTSPLSAADIASLREARDLLEHPGLAARLSAVVGTPMENGLRLLPANWNRRIDGLARLALRKAVDAAIFTMKDTREADASRHWHRWAATFSGGIGGFFGLAGLAVELPLSTTIMLRSIADIARSQGESIHAVETRVACLEVFALGGTAPSDDAAESGYYAVRAALAASVTDATQHLLGKATLDHSAPALARLIAQVADRFGVQITEKAAAQAIPAIGALGGAVINTIFIAHFQDMARGHFTVRRLERKYGESIVREAYAALPDD